MEKDAEPKLLPWWFTEILPLFSLWKLSWLRGISGVGLRTWVYFLPRLMAFLLTLASKLLTFEWQAAGPEFSNSFRKRKETRKTATDMFIPLLVILITKQKSPKFLFIFLFLQVIQGSSSHLQNYIVDSHKWLYCVSPHLFTVSSIQNNFASFFSYHLIFCFFSLFLFTFVDKILLIFTFFIMPMVYFLLLPSCNFNIF